jgi:glycosyltransferase involved in cell wall biosynthesis
MNSIHHTPATVSVVIPCYNQARFLSEAIESALAQTHRPTETIVVDDGSTDDTAQVAAGYAAVRYVPQRNRGQGAARNEGLKHVTGTFVVFLDSDDRLLPSALDTGVRCFEAHPERAFVAGRSVGIGPDGVQRSTSQEPLVDRNHYVALLRHNYIWTPGTAMFRTDVVRRVGGFKTKVCGAEDYDLYLRIARTHPIWCHGQTVVEYRQHDNRMSGNFPRMLSSTVRVMRGQRVVVKGDAQAAQALRDGLRFWQERYGQPCVNVLRRHWRERNWKGTVAGATALLLYHPSAFVQHARRKLGRVALGHGSERQDIIG